MIRREFLRLIALTPLAPLLGFRKAEAKPDPAEFESGPEVEVTKLNWPRSQYIEHRGDEYLVEWPDEDICPPELQAWVDERINRLGYHVCDGVVSEDGKLVCTVRVDGVDELIAELREMQRRLNARKPVRFTVDGKEYSFGHSRYDWRRLKDVKITGKIVK